MAVAEQTPYKEYTANGTTKSFPLGFEAVEQDHLIVLVNDLDQPVGSWSFDVADNTITFLKVPVSGTNIKIRRDTPLKRDSSYQSYNNSFKPKPVDEDFDSIWLKLQEMGVLNWMVNNDVKDLGGYVDSLNDETKAIFLAEIEKQGVSLNQLEQFTNNIYQNLANVAVSKGWLAEFIADGDENQKQINEKTIRTVNSINELLEIKKPKNGQTIYVKSHSNGTLKGGGEFVYFSDKNSINDGVITYSGWVRQTNKYKLNVEYAGATGDINQDIAPIMHKIFIYLYIIRTLQNDNNPVELYFPSGFYKPQTLIKQGGGTTDYPFIYMFPNMKVYGDGDSSILIMPENVMSMLPNMGRYYFFWLEILCVNTTVTSLKLDFNADTNYYPVKVDMTTTKQLCGYRSSWEVPHKDNLIKNVTFYRCASYNVIATIDWDGITSGWTVEDCRFVECGDGANHLNKTTDHSTIYLSGSNKTIRNNKFITVDGSYISCAIELHGDGEVYGNYFNNYALPFHAVAEEGGIHQATSNKGGGISNWRKNTVINAMYAISHNFRDEGNTVATFTDNYIHLRAKKASHDVDGLLFMHSAYESGGGINMARPTEKFAPKIYLSGNTFEQDKNLDNWHLEDMQINHCMTVKNVSIFEATKNTFIGFKGSILKILQQNGENVGSNKTRIHLKENTYIDCGFDMYNGYNTVAYQIHGDGVSNKVLGSLYTENETFINCKYDFMLGTSNTVVALNHALINVNVLSGDFISPYFDPNPGGTTFTQYKLRYSNAPRYNLDLPTVLPFSGRYGLDYAIKVDCIADGTTEFRNLTIHKNTQQDGIFIDVVSNQKPDLLDSRYTLFNATAGSTTTVKSPFIGQHLLYSWLYSDTNKRYEWIGTAQIGK